MSKKLYTSPDKKICGVCGGIAEYLNTDSTVIRLIFALVFLFFGYGLAVYIICAILFPAPLVTDGQYYDQQQFGPDPNAQYYNRTNYNGQPYQQPDGAEQQGENNNS